VGYWDKATGCQDKSMPMELQQNMFRRAWRLCTGFSPLAVAKQPPAPSCQRRLFDFHQENRCAPGTRGIENISSRFVALC
jgi:hypothetical protein